MNIIDQFFIDYKGELIAGSCYFVFVFFKAFQQRNVAFDHYAWIMPISYAMSLTEVIVISFIAIEAVKGWSWELLWFAVSIGTGGGLGAIAAMWFHNKYITKDKP
jgi:hypothetical protein